MSETLYLKNGNFIDVINGCSFPDGTGVLIKDGKIEAMPGLPGQPDAPEGCGTIDLQGKTVIPGLFNTHTHLQLMNGLIGHKDLKMHQMEKNMADCLACGITNIRDAWAPDLSINRQVTGRLASGALPGPRVQQCVVVCPQGNWCAPTPNAFNRLLMHIVDYDLPSSGVVTFRVNAGAREVQDAVDRAVDERGAQCIKFYDQFEKFMTYKPGGVCMTDEQIEAAANQAQKRGVPTTAHHTKARLFRRDVACGLGSLAHMPTDAELTEEDISAFLASDCMIEPTLSVSYGLGWGSVNAGQESDADLQALEAYRAQTFEGFTGRFWLKEMAETYRKCFRSYSEGKFKMLGLFDMSAPMRHHTKGIHMIAENTRRLYAAGAGARFACGNDATVVFYTQAAIQIEFALLELYLGLGGMRADAADLLRIATIQSAQAMKLDERFGSIAVGKTADLAVLGSDPLKDPGVIGSSADAVFKDGRLARNACGLKIR